MAVWACGGYYYQTVTLPKGTYTLTVPVYNGQGTQNTGTSYIGWIPNSGSSTVSSTTATTVGEWTTLTVTFSVAASTTGKICLGYVSGGSGSGAYSSTALHSVAQLVLPRLVTHAISNSLRVVMTSTPYRCNPITRNMVLPLWVHAM